MKQRSISLSLLVLMLLAGTALTRTAAEPAPRLMPKTKGWIEVRTENFTLISNAAARQTQKIGADLERFRTVLPLVTKGFDFQATVPTMVYVFKNNTALEPYKLDRAGNPRNIAGYFMERPFANYIAVDASAGWTPKQVIYHEYVHSLLHTTFHNIPLWLNEGLAEYYSTFRFRDGSNTAELGHPIQNHVGYLRAYGMIDMQDLFETTVRSSTYNEGERQGIFYAQSWLLVHYLAATDESRARFGTLLTRLREGQAPDQAVWESLGIEAPELVLQLEKYLEKGSNFYWITLDEGLARTASETRELDEGEVLYRLGDLLAHQAQGDWARRHLELALDKSGPKAGIYGALGAAAEVDGFHEQALDWYRKAVAESGDDSVHLARLGLALLERYIDSGPVVYQDQDTPEVVLEARALFRRSLAADSLNVEAMAGMGKSYRFGSEDREVGLRVLASAVTLRPFRVDIIHDLACLLADAGRIDAARAVIEMQLLPKDKDGRYARSAESWVNRVEMLSSRKDVPGESNEAESAGRRRLARDVEPGTEGRVVDVDEKTFLRINNTIDRFNEGIGLANAGQLQRALDIFEKLEADCGPADLCDQLAETRQTLRSSLQSKRHYVRYNEAIGLLNRDESEAAIEILREIEAETTDESLGKQVRSLLEAVGG